MTQAQQSKQLAANSNPQQTNHRKCKKYFLIDSTTKVYFNADFDSGNLQKVEQLSPYIYKLYPAYDKVIQGTEKTYFHFKVYGFSMCTVRFHIARTHLLEKLLKTGQQLSYKPTYKKGKSKYHTLQKGVKIYVNIVQQQYNKSDQAQLSIQYQFQQEQDWTYFSFSYPYSYQNAVSLVKQLTSKYHNHPQIYYHNQVLTYSQQGRRLDVVHVTAKINCTKQRQEAIQGLFPDIGERCYKINKPKVIVSGRVHPGQSPSSFCVEGLLRFLLDQKDYRAYLLRKNFHFIIVPMLNPDGVYNGLFRNDINGQNLNRVYLNCTKQKHPTIWGFRQFLMSLANKQSPVLFYFDFHAHPSKKQFFIYGNAFQQLTHQIEAETYGKLLQNNCPYFCNIDSIFTQKQMNSRDKNQKYTKQGCARVYVHRLFNIIHSYTVECGYFSPGKIQNWQPAQAIKKKSQVLTQQYTYVDTWQRCSISTYTPQSYMLMGKSILITILDLFHLNPYTRININELRSINTIRKNVGIKIYNCVQRFRLTDSNASKKLKQLNKIIEQQYYKTKVGKYGLSVSQNYGMRHQKKTFSLLSRVYQSKKQLMLNKILNADENIQQNEITSKNQKPSNYLQNNLQYQQHQEDQQQNQQYNQKLNQQEKVNQLQQNNVLENHHQSQINSFKQFKSQLQLKIQHLIPSQHIQKLEQHFLNQATHDCLHIAHLSNQSIVKLTSMFNIPKINLSNVQHQQEESNVNTNANLFSQRVKTFKKRHQILDRQDKTYKRIQSVKNLQRMKINQVRSLNKLNKVQLSSNTKSISIPIKSERCQSRLQGEKKSNFEDLFKIKSNRIDTFIKKQSNLNTNNKKLGDIQKFLTEKNKQKYQKPSGVKNFVSNVSRFPTISIRHIQTGKKQKQQYQ